MPLPVKSFISLLVLLQTPCRPKPYYVVSSVLQIESVSRAHGVCKKNVNLAIVPRSFIIGIFIYSHPKSALFKCLQKPVPFMLKAVKHKCVFPVKAFNKFCKRIYFTVVYNLRCFVCVIYGAACKLQKFTRKHCRHISRYFFVIYFKQHCFFKGLIRLSRFGIKSHRRIYGYAVGKF